MLEKWLSVPVARSVSPVPCGVHFRVGEIEKDIALAQSGFAMERYKALTETISRAASALADQAAAALNAVHASAGVSASGETD